MGMSSDAPFLFASERVCMLSLCRYLNRLMRTCISTATCSMAEQLLNVYKRYACDLACTLALAANIRPRSGRDRRTIVNASKLFSYIRVAYQEPEEHEKRRGYYDGCLGILSWKVGPGKRCSIMQSVPRTCPFSN